MKAFVWSVALYRSESWTLQKRHVERLEPLEMWTWRRMMRISWTEQKTKQEVLQAVRTQRELVDAQRARQKRWLGHVHGSDSLLRTVLGRLQGRKGSGRPRTMFLDWLLKNDEGNIDYDQLKVSAEDNVCVSKDRNLPSGQNTTEFKKLIIIYNMCSISPYV